MKKQKAEKKLMTISGEIVGIESSERSLNFNRHAFLRLDFLPKDGNKLSVFVALSEIQRQFRHEIKACHDYVTLQLQKFSYAKKSEFELVSILSN